MGSFSRPVTTAVVCVDVAFIGDGTLDELPSRPRSAPPGSEGSA
jgi:hypothetical protein